MSANMKAAVYAKTASGKVLEIREVAQPVPKDNEVLLRVRAASINPLDWRLKSQRPRMVELSEDRQAFFQEHPSCLAVSFDASHDPQVLQ